MEEFPELGHLNVKRLKDLHGTGRITARYIGKDSVSWQATHTMFVTTNYLPRVDESDHGTWRRLALVDFSTATGRPTSRSRPRRTCRETPACGTASGMAVTGNTRPCWPG